MSTRRDAQVSLVDGNAAVDKPYPQSLQLYVGEPAGGGELPTVSFGAAGQCTIDGVTHRAYLSGDCTQLVFVTEDAALIQQVWHLDPPTAQNLRCGGGAMLKRVFETAEAAIIAV